MGKRELGQIIQERRGIPISKIEIGDKVLVRPGAAVRLPARDLWANPTKDLPAVVTEIDRQIYKVICLALADIPCSLRPQITDNTFSQGTIKNGEQLKVNPGLLIRSPQQEISPQPISLL